MENRQLTPKPDMGKKAPKPTAAQPLTVFEVAAVLSIQTGIEVHPILVPNPYFDRDGFFQRMEYLGGREITVNDLTCKTKPTGMILLVKLEDAVSFKLYELGAEASERFRWDTDSKTSFGELGPDLIQ